MNINVTKLVLLTGVSLGFTAGALADGQDEPVPSFYEEPGLSRTRDFVNQHANERIDPFTGKLQWHYVDLFIPSNGGLDLKVQRSYTSPYMPDFSSPPWESTLTGLGWTMHFGRVIRNATTLICDTVNGPAVDPVLELADGSRRVLYLASASVSRLSSDLWLATCSPGGNGLDVFSPDGTRYEMTTLGQQIGSALHPQKTYYVSRITDRNGNSMDFSYATVNNLTGVAAVTTSDGRSLTFNYANGVLQNITDGARTWNYVLEPIPNVIGHYFLKQVTRPDGVSWVYEYNETGAGAPGDYALRKVTYPQGGTIDYTYGFVFFAQNPSIPRSTVVTQKVANPGGTWTWAYEPATQPLAIQPDGSIAYTIPPQTPEETAQSDRTTVTGPEGAHTHYHIGYNSSFSGIVYLIGWQLGTASATTFPGSGTFPTQYSAFWPTGIQVSDRPNFRPGGTLAADAVTLAPLLRRSVINRNGQLYDALYDTFDNFGNPQSIVETGTHTRSTAVTYYTDPAKWIIHLKKNETATEGGETLAVTRQFDLNGNLLNETRSGVPTDYTYTAAGDVATRTNARNKTWNYLNYFRGIPQTENQPEVVSLTRVVSAAGNVTSETDGELATTGFSYDGLNRVTGITHPIGNPVTVAWTATTRTVTRGAYRQVTTYDGFGREARVDHTDTLRSETISQAYGYDALGRRVYASYPDSLALGTGFDYDVEDQLLTVLHEFSPSSGGAASGRGYFYAVDDVQVTNERGFLYTFKYRSYGDPGRRELVRITTPPELPDATTDIARNIAGQMTSVTQNAVTRSYGYDTRFFLTSVTDPETAVTTMGRDEVGNMTTRQVGISAQTGYGYDDRDRMTTITYPAGTPSVVQTYFKDDKLKSSDNGFARCDYTYDANKNLRTDTLTIGVKTFLSQYSYDGNDALDALTYGSGKVVAYAPDAFGRPRQVAPYVTAVAYHPTGQPSGFTYANGVVTTVGLNTRQWPSTLQIAKGSDYFNITYLYDDLGNVNSISNPVDTAYNRSMLYDPLDRVTTVTGPWGSASLGYDARGNITSQNFGAFNLTYTYDAPTQRLQSVSGSKTYAFAYDAYGNVSHNGAMSFAYNDAPNLRCANCGLPNEILFDYDGRNQRVRVTKGGAETYFVHGQGGQLLWEESPNASLKEYVYLGGKQVAVREQALP